MECINCDRYYDDDEEECPYCGFSKYAVRCEDCGDIIDIDCRCYCGRSLDDLEEDEDSDYYDPYKEDEEDEEDETYYGDDICENCTYWQAHPQGYSYGMICQRTGANTNPNDSCSDFSKMFHFSNYGEEGQYSFVDTEQVKQRKLNYWHNRKF